MASSLGYLLNTLRRTADDNMGQYGNCVFLGKPGEAMKYFSNVITMENYRDDSRNTCQCIVYLTSQDISSWRYGKSKRQRIS